MVYQRNGRSFGGQQEAPVQPQKKKVQVAPPENEFNSEDTPKQGVRINGFEQVLELLKAADEEFRVSLLKRLHGKNPKLGVMLYQELVLTGHIKG